MVEELFELTFKRWVGSSWLRGGEDGEHARQSEQLQLSRGRSNNGEWFP